jgi:O-antigen ligase
MLPLSLLIKGNQMSISRESIYSNGYTARSKIFRIVICFAIGIFVGLCILRLNYIFAIALVGGGIITLGSMFSLEFGLTSLLVLVILFPREELFSFSIPFFGGGLKATDILLFAILSGWTIRVCFLKRNISNLLQSFTVLIVAFVGWSIMSAVIGISNGVYYKYSLLELRPTLLYLIYLPILSEFDFARVRRVIWVVLLASTIVSIKGIILYSFGIGEPATYTGGDIRVMSIGFSYLLFCLLLTMSFYTENVWKKIPLLLIMIISLSSLAITFQRSAWLGLAISTVFICYASGHQARKRLLKAFAYLTIFVLLVYTGTAMRSASSLSPVVALERRLTSVLGYKEDVSAQHRLEEWTAAINRIQTHPIMGNGLGYQLKFYSPMYSEESKREGFASSDFYIHNSYVWIATKMGIIGLGLFTAIIFSILRTGIHQSLVLKGNEKAVMIGLTSCLVALFVVSFFGPMFNEDNLAPFVGFTFGAIQVVRRSNHRETVA